MTSVWTAVVAGPGLRLEQGLGLRPFVAVLNRLGNQKRRNR